MKSYRAGLALLAALATAATLAAAPAQARDDGNPGAPLQPRTHFTMNPDGSSGLVEDGSHLPNMDSDKATVRAYYGATSAGIANKTSSPYISELHAIEASTLASLPAVDPASKKAI